MAPSASSRLQKRRRWTRDQLLRNLELIGTLKAPLPPALPPSPPVSRSASPAPGSKRKLDPSSDPDQVKRPRTVPALNVHHTHQQPPPQPQAPTRQPPPPPQSASRSAEPCEDGELREETTATFAHPRSSSSVQVPIRRPRKGRMVPSHLDSMHDFYYAAGRKLKYSGDARFWSTYPPTHRDYRPILDPPQPGSLYHQHGGLIARLELMDALVCFTYSLWCRDYGRRICTTETWTTIESFLRWCKQKWQAEEGVSDPERAFLGVIWMIEGFIKCRIMHYSVKGHLDSDMGAVNDNISTKISAVADAAVEGDPTLATALGLPSGKAPPMLPSPSSANSTPVNRDDGTPRGSTASNRPPQPAAHATTRQSQYTGIVPYTLLPSYFRENPTAIPSHVMNSMSAVTEPIGPTLVHELKTFTTMYVAASYCLATSQSTLNLPVIRRCFPNTWARMMHSTLLPTDEHEPDFEDEEGELFWPDQCVNGEGIGWVCLMGKAMIKEFGKAYGYKGLEGVVSKPRPGPVESQSDRPGSSTQRTGPPTGTSSSHPPNHRSSTTSSAPR